jgi:hypothetical protein
LVGLAHVSGDITHETLGFADLLEPCASPEVSIIARPNDLKPGAGEPSPEGIEEPGIEEIRRVVADPLGPMPVKGQPPQKEVEMGRPSFLELQFPDKSNLWELPA